MGWASWKTLLLWVMVMIFAVADPNVLCAAESINDDDSVVLQPAPQATFFPVDSEEAPLLFFEAAREGRNDVIDNLLKAGTEVDVKDNRGYTPLFLAIYNNNLETVKMLLQHGANACSADNNGDTPLMISAYKGNEEIFQTLLAAFCPVDQQNQQGKTALMIATLFDHIKIVALLLKTHANPALADKDGQTAVQIARQQYDENVITLLQAALPHS